MNYLDSRPKFSATSRSEDTEDLHERAMEGKYLVDREEEPQKAIGDADELDEDSWFNDDPDADGVDELNFE